MTQPALAQPISQTDADPSAFDCILGNILEFMLPFFLVSAGGNTSLARTSIKELIDAYQPTTPIELDLVGWIIGFSIAAMDNLRLSMAQDLSATKVLRYRSNAVTLVRSGAQDPGGRSGKAGAVSKNPPPLRRRRSAASHTARDIDDVGAPRPEAPHGRLIERRADQWRRLRIPRD